MPDPFMSLVSAVLDAGPPGLRLAVAEGITPSHLQDPEAADAYRFILDHAAKYSVLPTREHIAGFTDIDVPASDGQKLEVWIDSVKRIRLHFKLDAHRSEIQGLLQGHAPEKAWERTLAAVEDIRAERLATLRVHRFADIVPDVISHYEAIKGGLRGIPFPWKTLNIETFGMWPEDLVLFVARTSVGKTWALILITLTAWKDNRKVLFISTEMARRTIVQRFLAMYEKLPYRAMRRGDLDIYSEPRLYKAAQAFDDDNRLLIVGGDFDFSMDAVDASIGECEPELCVLDGAYLLRVPGRTRNERMAEAYNGLARLKKKYGIPIAVSAQFNREAKVGSVTSSSIDNIGLSDVGGQNADLAFALVQDEKQRQDGIMTVHTMKARESVIPDFDSNWDFDTMHFGDQNPYGGGDADEHGTPDDVEEDPIF